MNTFISILRGINVSGQKIIKMADLKMLYEKLGYKNVRTYIQSGNVIFKHSENNVAGHINKIHDEIKNQYGFDVSVIIRTPEEFQKIIAGEPFKLNSDQLKRLYVTFLSENGKLEKLSQLEKYMAAKDKCHLSDNHLYFYCPEGYGKTKLSNNMIEKVFGISATTRNWNSVCKLYELT
ncbi:MAG: DUF1697 domain-containing protein [Calditrichae bacterium]|nr:DUF1697 domain-containing protein [Calditrichia bacterium]